MYRLGHVGAALVVYAPVGLALLLADLPGLAVVGGALSFSLASLPDVDHKLPLVSHRGVTHTFLFAIAVGLAIGAAGWLLGGTVDFATSAQFAAFGFVVGTGTIVSHLFADAITPMGVTPFCPVSGRHYTLGLTRADNTVANYLLLTVGLLAVAAVLAVGSSLP